MRMHTLKLSWMVGIGAVLLQGCGDPKLTDTNKDGIDDGVYSTTVVAPSYVTGTVTGLVLAAETGEPIPADVTVTLIAGAHQPAPISAEDGRFTFEDVPAGTGISLHFSAGEGYTEALVHTTLDAEIGNFPASNAHVFVGPVELMAVDSSISAQVIGPSGRALANHNVFLDTNFAYFVDGAIAGRIQRVGTTDENGIVSFDALPSAARLAARIAGGQFIFTVPAYVDAGSATTYNGTTETVSVAQAAVQAVPTLIVLPYASGATPLSIVASNIADLVGNAPTPRPTPSVLAKEGQIFIAFNQPVEADSLLLQIVSEEGGQPFAISDLSSGLNTVGNILSVPLSGLAVQAGQEYNLYIEARPAQIGAGGAYRGAVTFFIESTADEPAKVTISSFFHEEVSGDALINTGDYIWFRFVNPIGARLDNGSAAATTDFLPIYVRALGDVDGSGNPTGADHPMEFGYLGEELPPKANLIERLPPGGQYVASGYSTLLRLTLPAGVSFGTGGNVTFQVTFNNPVGATATQRYRVATPQGVLPEPPNKASQLVRDPN